MKKENKGSMIVVIIIFIITLALGIYGLIMSLGTEEEPQPPVSSQTPSLTLENSYSFNELRIDTLCDFTTTNICEKMLGSMVKNNITYNLNIKYEKLENDEYNFTMYSNSNEFIKLEKIKGELNTLKVFKKTYLIIDTINNSDNILRIYDEEGINIEQNIITTKGNIIYNEDTITFSSLNCDSEFKDNLFNATLKIEDNKTNILYEKTEELNNSGIKCQ